MTNGIVIGLASLAGVWMGWYAIPFCLSILLVVRLLEQNRDPAILLVCLVFATIGAIRSTTPPTETPDTLFSTSTGAIGTVAGFPRPTTDGHRVPFALSQLCINSQCIDSEFTVLVTFPSQEPPLARGQKLRVSWRTQTLQDLPTGYRSFVAAQGAEGTARATSTELLQGGPVLFEWMAKGNQLTAERIQGLIPGNAGALATGIVTGDDSALDEDTKDNFRATGTSHITAVSGQNVSITVGFLSLWFRPARPSTRLIFHLVLLCSIWSFTMFVGMESPALRAAIVATLTIIGSHIGRRPDPVTLLSITLGAIAVINPLVVHTVGFWLSAVASMALCLVLPHEFSKDSSRSWLRLALGPAVASVATMPIALSSFGVWSPVGILANLMIAPIMAVAFQATYALALFSIVLPPVASTIAVFPTILLEIVLVIINELAPVSMQIRVDSMSPTMLILIWSPIILTIWLISGESERWLRRAILNWSRLRRKRQAT